MNPEDRIAEKLLNAAERVVRMSCFLFCLLLMMGGVWALYDTALLYYEASDQSVLRFRPQSSGETGNLYESLRGSVSWLVLDGAGVDDPVMQGKDNMEYLNRNPLGEFSLAGSLFLDCRSSADFSDPYSMIYGHHMDHHMMFGALDQYMEKEFFDTHDSGRLYVNDEILELKIIAAAECSAYDQRVFEPGEADQVKEFIRNHALYLREFDPEEDRRIVAFSTCRYPDTESRTVIFALIL